MSEQSNEATEPAAGPYEPGVYVKGDKRRVARSRAVAVALVFDGYKLEKATTSDEERSAPTAPTATVAASTPSPKALEGRKSRTVENSDQ